MFTAIIVGAGNGIRMNLGYNKILAKIKDKPIFLYAIETFKKFSCEIVLVINPNDEEIVRKYCPCDVKIIFGGKTRMESVYQGLKAATKKNVFIHDAARPFVTEKIIQDCLIKLKDYSSFFVAVPVKDTIKQHTNDRYLTMERSSLLAAQTPQGGDRQLFLEVYKQSFINQVQVSDDIALIEIFTSEKIGLVEGCYTNLKVTTLEDLKYVEYLLNGG